MKIIIFGVIALFSVHSAFAQFSGQGTGTEKDPYIVSNADELFEVRNDLKACYKQIEDIDLTIWIIENCSDLGWIPIGTEGTPFSGTYDGNNKSIKGLYINRPNSDNVGLFGYCSSHWNDEGYTIIGVHIKNCVLINAKVNGNNNVGTIAGSFKDGTLKDCVVVHSIVNANKCAGGVIGYSLYPYVSGCYADVQVTSTESVAGGLIGEFYCGTSGVPSHLAYIDDYVCDNTFNGTLNGQRCGGTIGMMSSHYNCGYDFSESSGSISRNIVSGYLRGEQNAYGISEVMGPSQFFSNNVCLLDTIESNGVQPCRISAYETINNYSINSTIVLNNHKVVRVDDDGRNGTSYGAKILSRQSTYMGMGFDFNSQWDIIEGKTYPFNKSQSTPPKVLSFTSGSRGTISGTAVGNGIAYVFVNGSIHETSVVDGEWTAKVGNISEGSKAYVCVRTDKSKPSIVVESISVKPQLPEPNIIWGDSNSDGVVDAADVVGTINYILGKPSSSFNQQNADVNEDGQILVDDAVGTVNVIMNNQ